MVLKREGYCLACDKRLAVGASVNGRQVQGEWFFLCPVCSGRLGENSLRRVVVEALLLWRNDPNVGGPDDPLDHEDYAVLQALGLWSIEDVEV